MWNIDKLMHPPNLPVRHVSRAEFIRTLTSKGETLAKAELQAKFAVGLGSKVLVGDEYLQIRK